MKSENATIITQSTKESTIQHLEKKPPSINNESFKVYIRIRPFIQKIIPIPKNSFIKPITSPKDSSKNNILEKNMIKVDKNILYLEDVKNKTNKNNKAFIFDNIFVETSNNEMVFNGAIKSLMDKVLNGYNSTALAYGVTGTGKTYTVFGDLSNNFKDEGIIFKACDYLFEKIQLNKNLNKTEDINYEIKISYIEIYNEIVKDLINDKGPSLMIVEEPQKGVICSNVKEVIITDSVQLKKIINESNKRRTMASTDQNQFSSRSHAILQMTLEKKIKKSEENYDIIYSKFLVVDLAGSEKSMERGKRREEGVNINKSLFTLGNCLNILSEKSNTGKFVPYRDSKLTRILKDSLGGNILTAMLACISPCSSTYDETLSTLNYAFRAKKITKKVMQNIQEININNFQYKEIIDNLKNEISQLKQIIKNQEIKLKEKIDINNNKENLEINYNEQINSNINESYRKFDTISSNDIIDDNIIIYDNKQRTKAISEREENKKNENINKLEILNIDLDIYNRYVENIINNDLSIDNLKFQIESIKKDKIILENYLLKENIQDNSLISKYNSLKKIYDKYIEIVNEKLVENIEQNMIYNFNIKEITELNIVNENKVKELELQNTTPENNIKLNEELEYTKKNIIENNIQKEQIYQNIQENNEQKEELKQLLLNLFENKFDYSNDKYIHIIHEKDKLSKITKQYKKEIDYYVKMQKQKEEDMMKITRKVEILRAKLKEKDKKIYELEKKGGNSINIKLYKNKKNQNMKKESSKITNYKNIVKSPPNCKAKNNSRNSNSNDFRIENKNEKHNKSFGKEKKLNIFLNNKNREIIKKSQKNTQVCKNDKENNSLETTENKNIKKDLYSSKYNKLIVPKTTITLIENEQTEKNSINPLYIKMPPIKGNKKKSDNNVKKIKKFSQINYKRNSSTNNSIKPFSKKKKKISIKSFKVDLINNNKNKSGTNLILQTNSRDSENKNKKNNISIETNLINIKEFKAEKINIDLTEMDKASNVNMDDKNNTKYLNLKTEVNNIGKNINNNQIKLNKEIKKISKSNPKITKEKKRMKSDKKLSLKEARYEKKLKYVNIKNQNNDLIYAKSFIDDYKKNKNDNILIDANKTNIEDKISVNTEPNICSLGDKESKSSFIYNQRIYKYKTFNETIDSS